MFTHSACVNKRTRNMGSFHFMPQILRFHGNSTCSFQMDGGEDKTASEVRNPTRSDLYRELARPVVLWNLHANHTSLDKTSTIQSAAENAGETISWQCSSSLWATKTPSFQLMILNSCLLNCFHSTFNLNFTSADNHNIKYGPKPRNRKRDILLAHIFPDILHVDHTCMHTDITNPIKTWMFHALNNHFILVNLDLGEQQPTK